MVSQADRFHTLIFTYNNTLERCTVQEGGAWVKRYLKQEIKSVVKRIIIAELKQLKDLSVKNVKLC